MTIAIFVLILGITMAITYWAARRTKTASEFYAAGRSLKSSENGFAITGDYLSAATFLGFTGLVALFGMDGSLYAVGALVAFLGVLLFVAEPLRNTGKFTMADVIAYRMQRRPARLAAVVGTIVVSLAYLIPQMAGGGVLIKLLLGIPYSVSVIVVGLAMVLYVAFGGMLATTWVQIVKAILLMSIGLLLLVWIMALFRFNPLALFASAEGANAAGVPLTGGLPEEPARPDLCRNELRTRHGRPAAHPDAVLYRAGREDGPGIGALGCIPCGLLLLDHDRHRICRHVLRRPGEHPRGGPGG
jgi:cation/acetate symporter